MACGEFDPRQLGRRLLKAFKGGIEAILSDCERFTARDGVLLMLAKDLGYLDQETMGEISKMARRAGQLPGGIERSLA